MSLAMFAASIDDTSNIMDNHDNTLNQKRHKRTLKRYPKIESFDTEKVSSVLQKIHNKHLDDEDEEDTFNPPPKPFSAGVDKTIRESFSANSSFLGGEGENTIGKTPSPYPEKNSNLDLNDLQNYGDTSSHQTYYKKILPSYEPRNQPYQQKSTPYQPPQQTHTDSSYMMSEQDILLKKINYMISLLEEQQDEKTNNITEEVILYSFLGIFIIFITDTVFRAGIKYKR